MQRSLAAGAAAGAGSRWAREAEREARRACGPLALEAHARGASAAGCRQQPCQGARRARWAAVWGRQQRRAALGHAHAPRASLAALAAVPRACGIRAEPHAGRGACACAGAAASQRACGGAGIRRVPRAAASARHGCAELCDSRVRPAPGAEGEAAPSMKARERTTRLDAATTLTLRRAQRQPQAFLPSLQTMRGRRRVMPGPEGGRRAGIRPSVAMRGWRRARAAVWGWESSGRRRGRRNARPFLAADGACVLVARLVQSARAGTKVCLRSAA
jgi:hypothetical protein